MRFKTQRSHSIDFIFPLSVLFVFASSALLILILCAHIYAVQTSQEEINYRQYTPLSYITEKIRQNDTNGSLSVVSVDQTTCLCLTGSADNISYTTWLYVTDGWLKELSTRDGADISLSAGTNIIQAEDLSVTKLQDHLYKITITDTNGQQNSRIVAERSRS